MNNWIPLLVIVAFLIIWIVSNVLRASQDDSRGYKRNTNPRTNIGESKPIQQNSNNDIDRFLQEIDRLRKKSPTAERSPRPEPKPITRTNTVAKPTTPRPKPEAPAKKPKPVTRRVETPPPPTPPSRPSSTEPKPFEAVAQPVVTPPSYEITPVQAPQPIVLTAGISSAILGKGAGEKAAQKEVIDALQSILNGPNGPKMAIMLKEIFGPPKSARPL
jgi:outer membrane biosynthesis protein TonB